MKVNRKLRNSILLAALLLVLLVTSCGLAPVEKADGVTSLQVIYNRVVDGTFDAWGTSLFLTPFLWGVFWFLIVALIATLAASGGSSGNMGSGCTVGILIGCVVAALAFFVVAGSMNTKVPGLAKAQATHAMLDGVSKAKDMKANQYIEDLHAPVILTAIDYLDCRVSEDTSSNCYPYERTARGRSYDCNCTDIKDSDGKKIGESCQTCYHTDHIPYLNKLCQYRVNVRLSESLATPETGLKPFAQEQGVPYRYLSDRWMVPVDYNNYWRDGSRRNFSPSDYTPPADWTRFDNLLKAGVVPLVTVSHRYMNWIFVTDSYGSYAGDVATYEKAGLLPTMNRIYSRIGTGWATDYDLVQFIGITVDQKTNLAWQDAMYLYLSYVANARKVSVEVVFAKKSTVTSLGTVDKWADTIKAHYSQKGKWDFVMGGETLQRLAPKNLFVLACVVDDTSTKVPSDGCRLRGMMPGGNEDLMDTFAFPSKYPELKDVAFTPESFFGKLTTSLVPKDKSAYPMVALQTSGGRPMDLLLRPDPLGLKRVDMKDFEYLKTDLKLEPKDIDALVEREVEVQANLAFEDIKTAFMVLGGLIMLVVTLVGGAVMHQ